MSDSPQSQAPQQESTGRVGRQREGHGDGRRGLARLAALPGWLHDKVPAWQDIDANPVLLRRAMNLWPPFLFAGIRVVEVLPEFRGATVELRLHALSRNYMGTQYGGSLYSMTDPFWVILLMNRLGPGYVVWDRRAEIDYLRPGRTTVRTTFTVPDDMVAEIRQAAETGQRVLRWVSNDIVDTHGTVIATVRREIYVRRAPQTESASSPDSAARQR